jgi:transposase
MDTHTVTAQERVAVDTRGRRIAPRRHRPIEEKRAIVAEASAAGASIAEVARRYGVNANLVFHWKRLAERGLLETHTRRMSGRRLVPVKLLEAKAAPPTAAGAATATLGMLRVQFPSGIALEIGGTPDAQLLERLIGLLRG